MNHHGLLEGVSPGTQRAGARLQRAELRATVTVAVGVVATFATLAGPNRIDLLAFSAPAIGLMVTMVGLIALYLEKWSDKFVRVVLALGAAGLILLGFLSLGHSSVVGVTIGCFTPALLFLIAGFDLARSRRDEQGV